MIQPQEIRVQEIATKSKLPDADFVINPYIGCPHKCIYCYAEFMKRFTNHPEPWGEFLGVKICQKPLKLNLLSGKTVLLSSVTDPYNGFEAKYLITQEILRQLVNSNARVEILTKSKLVLRDLEIIKECPNIKVGISLNTLDDSFRKQTEPFASSIQDRVETLKALKKASIKTYLFVSPIFPGITNFTAIVDLFGDIVDYYCFENLNLRGTYKDRVLKFITNYRPDLAPLYYEIYSKKNNSYWEEVRADIIAEFAKNHLPYKIYFYHDQIKK